MAGFGKAVDNGENICVTLGVGQVCDEIKSMVICDQGRRGVGKGCSRPAGSCLSDLVVLHVLQLRMK